MSTTEKWVLGGAPSGIMLLSTQLNSLPNNSGNNSTLDTPFDNTQGAGSGDGYVLCDLELTCTFGVAPAASTAMSLWLLESLDGTNYEDGTDGNTTPATNPDVVFPVRAVTTQQRVNRKALLSWGKFKPLLKNDGTGQALASSGNTLKIRPVSRQLV